VTKGALPQVCPASVFPEASPGEPLSPPFMPVSGLLPESVGDEASDGEELLELEQPARRRSAAGTSTAVRMGRAP